jgi:hypothetical protein
MSQIEVGRRSIGLVGNDSSCWVTI